MIALVVVALAVAALSPALQLTRAPRVVPPLLALGALAVAAITTAAAPPARGVMLALVVVAAAVAAVAAGGPLVLAVFRIARRTTTRTDDARDTEDRPRSDGPLRRGDDGPLRRGDDGPLRRGDDGPLRGGRVIGVLERAAVAAAVLAGWPEGIAIVLAVKGLARYPELREPQASEQFIIGTFTSVLWSLGAAAIGRVMLT
ncbi:hypothetical protein DW322_14065 [Rhodococcus rhodnii]|uniref:Uncharacterized protein n=2 Tax=Rhodococcus rhodnii TaxID=38312 RepID=R7WLY0_9NOCA|nr:hypothetical protein [Rhodococcus rhodnii]EOM75034.1 hypothetical protein Rrhod_3647 [Rhodococcus rhodnii LMG 5362]TXG91138.1 hypothetical protein DW322_14065 [Rhodococcus rhodnii]